MLKKVRNVVFTTVLLEMVMNMNAVSLAESSRPWYFGFKPMYERQFKEISDGAVVEKIERLTAADVSKILSDLSENEEFVGLARSYVARTKGAAPELSETEDAQITNEISEVIKSSLSPRGLKMDYFFANSLALDLFQRIDRDDWGARN